MTDRKVELNGPAAQVRLTQFAGFPPGRVGLPGHALGDGLLMALLHAEVMAANAGVGAYPVLGERIDYPTVGAARERVGEMRPDVATAYLAVHGAVRLAHLSAAPFWRWPSLSHVATQIDGLEGEGLGVLPAIPAAVWWIAGSGLVAAITGAWYYATETKNAQVTVDGDKARAAQVASAVTSMAAPYIAAGQPIPPALLEPLKTLATVERASPVLPWAAAALVGGVAVGAFLGGGRGD